MKIYIDAEFKCHTQAADDRTAVETDFFDGMCSAYIEGYRYIPTGKVWKAIDGTVYPGEMITPWKPWAELDEVQRAYEREQAAALEAALSDIEEALGL